MTSSDKNIYVEALKKDNAELTKQYYDVLKKYKVKSNDAIINEVIDRIFTRHIQGMERFKQTMDENPKTIDDWIEDIIEECIDAVCYLVVLKKRLHKVDCLAQIEEVKKEADELMIKKIDYYEKEIALVREQAQIDILTKDRDLNAKDKELGRLYKKINELESRNGKETKVGR